jgi:hypothetical protein
MQPCIDLKTSTEEQLAPTLCLFSCSFALSRSTSARRSNSCSCSSRACTCRHAQHTQPSEGLLW